MDIGQFPLPIFTWPASLLPDWAGRAAIARRRSDAGGTCDIARAVNTPQPLRAGAEALCRARARPGRFLLTVARMRGRGQRIDQPPRDAEDLVHRPVEGRLVGFRWRRETGQLAHELQRRRADLLVGCGRLEVEQGLDAS